MQFLSEKRLNGCQIFGRFGFSKLNPNQFSVFCTPVGRTALMLCSREGNCRRDQMYWQPTTSFMT